MWWIVLAVVLGGAAISLQAPINAALARELGAPVPAAAVSFGVGFLVLVLIALAQGHGPSFLRLVQVPPWMLVGGFFWGWICDTRGRRTALFASIATYSVANLANALVQSVEAYAVLRFIAGLGLAGELGAGIALISELLGPKRRGYGATP